MVSPRRPRPAFVLAAAFSLAGLSLTGCSSAGHNLGDPAEAAQEATADGTELAFGQTARVVTTSFDTGVPVYWDVSVNAPTTLTPQEVEVNVGQDPPSIDLAPGYDPDPVKSYSCFTVTLTAVAGGPQDGGADVTVDMPQLSPVDASGQNANYVDAGDARYCGLDTDNEPPSYTGDIRTGHEYTTAVVTWRGEHDPGIVGTAVRLSTTPSPHSTDLPAQTLTWRAS
ncbi:hypothetical protein CAPI_07950 [Corynebacterium capitovis DSM 44611]|uniref:hypothetical protein n=1 Tax=Corynebacterium capitovis TaxID=131081 RepID=UPI00037D46E7|nr:hypothetical protein [Corynebacterium capitovis]WKD58118.1 hypothetical protein CAPI_07950 [Corynebacterium capitovis DSM 44611]